MFYGFRFMNKNSNQAKMEKSESVKVVNSAIDIPYLGVDYHHATS